MCRRVVKPRFWVFLVLFEILIFGILIGVNMLIHSVGNRTLAKEREIHDALYLNVMEFERELDFVKTNDYIEQTAREELDFLYPNEVRYVAIQD